MTWESGSAAMVILLPVVLLAGLTFTVLIDPYIRRDHRRIMLIVIGLIFTLIAQNLCESALILGEAKPYARTLAAIYGYSARPAILALLFYIVGPRRSRRLVWAMVAVNAAVHLTALWSGICFRITEANSFRRGPLGYSCHVISGILLAQLLYLTLSEYRRARKSEALIPVCNAAVIIISVALDSFAGSGAQPVTYLTGAVVVSTVFYYIWLHLQFVRDHERALQAEQRIQIMMSQIQPHFLFNTLSSIQALCRIDPEKAFRTTGMLGAYLRENIDSLDRPDLIPIRKELEHTRVYAEIEMTRFENIRVEYDIRDDNFRVPALTVQPLVENAIRHGVRIRRDGLVTVATRMRKGWHTIVIRDNGKGFDARRAAASGGAHIGLSNVRERVERMCGGVMNVYSRVGEGTTVEIRIPARRGYGKGGDRDEGHLRGR